MVNPYNNVDIIGWLFCGSLGMLTFFVGFIYLKNRENLYAYYALFLAFMLIYSLTSIKADTWINTLLDGQLRGNKRLIEPITILSFSCYTFFTIELMEVRSQSKWIYHSLKTWGICCITYAILYFLLYPWISSYEPYIFAVVRVIIFSLSTWLIIGVVREIESPVKNEFVAGTLAYYIGSVVATIRFLTTDLPIPLFYELNAPSYFEMGILVETTFFALALGKRMLYLNNEKQKAKEELIGQMVTNDMLMKQMNRQLELKIKAREREILAKQEELMRQEKKILQVEFEKKHVQSEMRSRSMQMNPHFIFNCLNSIKYLIQSDQNKKATTYLVIFSRFIREILDTSQSHVISLKTELDIIGKYLQLEQNRFSDDFSFGINYKDPIALHAVFVPPLLLQPFVENAIWHGLLPSKKTKKMLYINVRATASQVKIIIEDNGIGRKKSMEILKNRIHKSQGIALTEERIKLFNHYYNNALEFEIIDKIAGNGAPAGTRVEVTLKNTYKTDIPVETSVSVPL